MSHGPRHNYLLDFETTNYVVTRCHNCGLQRRQGTVYGYRQPRFFIRGRWERGLPLGACPQRPYDWGPQAICTEPMATAGSTPVQPAPPQPKPPRPAFRPPMTDSEFVARVDRVVEFAFVHIARVVQQIHQKWRQEMKR